MNSRFQRRPVPVGRTAPETGKPQIHRTPASGSSGSGVEGKRPPHRMASRPSGKFLVLISALWYKILPCKAAIAGNRTQQRQQAARKRRFIVYAGCAAVVIAVVLLVLLAPGGFAASAPDATPTLSSISPSSTPEATATGTPVPTTEPEGTATFAPTATPKPSPTATPKPTTTPKQTATATPRPSATATPKPSETPSPSPNVDINTLVAFYAEEADTYYDKVGYSSNHYEYTDEELTILAKIIQTEAGGESDTGKIAVGNVVINRVLCGRWGSTIDAVKGGFAYHEDTVPKQAAINAAHAVLDDEVWVVPQNTYYFKASEGDWRTYTLFGQIGNHYFYTYNYSGRYNGDSIPAALFDRVYKYAQYGCKPSERIYRIQYMLKALGYDVQADKYFGDGTRKAILKFQQDHGLDADGVAGPATMKALIRTFGVDAYCEKFPS